VGDCQCSSSYGSNHEETRRPAEQRIAAARAQPTAERLHFVDLVGLVLTQGAVGSVRVAPNRLFLDLADAFPDLHITVEDLIAEGDRVVGRVTFRGTHSKDFQGMPATGKQIEMQVIDILRVEDGKIMERWGVADNLAMMQQLGAMPA
jgi:steroid delta-isomerase-like uncharacterized protein